MYINSYYYKYSDDLFIMYTYNLNIYLIYNELNIDI
jgi:hypothetical protein